MANAPLQYPNVDLPQAEYFSLAPNHTIAIQGRRRVPVVLPGFSVPASGTHLFVGNGLLEQPFPAGAAIYVHDVALVWYPQDATAQLQVLSSDLGLNISTTSGDTTGYHLGQPSITGQAPGTGQLVLSDRDKLITQRELAAFNIFTPAPPPGQLVLSYNFFVKNLDGAAAHSGQTQAYIVYTRLDGVLE